MKIAIIDNYDSFVYNLFRYVREIEGTEVKLFKNDQIDYPYLDSCDALLLSPGPGIPSEAGDLLEVIKRYHLDKKILGICLGHQAIGEFFGAKLHLCEKPIHGKASTVKIVPSQGLFEGISEEIQVGRYHSWVLNPQLSPELELIGLSEEGEVMAIRHRFLPIEGLQFHPESILTSSGRQMINNWVNIN